MYSKNPLEESELLSKLHQFSETTLWATWSKEEQQLFSSLEELKIRFHFPAVKNDVGQALGFLTSMLNPQTIFEMGSGYGHSAFWYLVGQKNLPARIELTEKRSDLMQPFHALAWPSEWRGRLAYTQGDAFERLEQVSEIDLALVDGEKAQYLNFLMKAEEKMSKRGVVVIDNAFIKGTFLQPENQHKEVVKKTQELYQYIKTGPWTASFLPVRDGLLLLNKR